MSDRKLTPRTPIFRILPLWSRRSDFSVAELPELAELYLSSYGSPCVTTGAELILQVPRADDTGFPGSARAG
jgi:hypothetical protein